MWQYTTDDAARTELAYHYHQAQAFIGQQRLADLATCCRAAYSW